MGKGRRGKNEKGSTSVLLLLILASLLGVVFLYIGTAQKVVHRSTADSVFFLAGRSILAGYDGPLKENYGIMAFAGSEQEIESLLETYASATLETTGTTWEDLEVNLTTYSLLDQQVFQQEILGYTTYALARSLIEDTGLNGGNGEELYLQGDRTLRNKKVIQALPSQALEGDSSLWKKIQAALDTIGDIFDTGTDQFTTNIYILNMFKSAEKTDVGHDTFFSYEVEYILAGNLSDKENRLAVRNQILLLRNAINLAYLYSDTEKQALLAAAAEVLAPGPGAAAMQVVLTEAWALLEAENDLQLLEHGKKVAVYKTDDSWATDIQSAIEGYADGYIDTDTKVGLDYRDYLWLLLFFQEDTLTLARTMDLIQINMQGLSSQSFLLQDHYLGLTFSVTVEGKTYTYEHTY